MKRLQYCLGDLAKKFSVDLKGDPDCLITGLASLEKAESGQLTFLSDPRHQRYLLKTKASAVIVEPKYLDQCPTHALVSNFPRACYARIATLFLKQPDISPGLHASVVVGKDCRIADTASVGPYCVIGHRVLIGEGVVLGAGCIVEDDVCIGDASHLWPRVTVCYGVRIGNRTVVHSGAVLGSDGFGMTKDETGRWLKIPQLGSLCIGDDVEIGANTTIDRGALDDTIIESGVKLDNQIQIAHNVRIGQNTVMAACTGISGSVVIGKDCILAGGVGIGDNVTIADGVMLGGMAGVSRSIKETGQYASSTPLMPYNQWRKVNVRIRQLDDIARQVNKIKEDG